MASQKLKALGPLKRSEKSMIAVFLLILFLWIFGERGVPVLGEIGATTTAFVGLSALLLTGVLTWSDIKRETSAWDTLVWFSALVMMATYLDKLGLIAWFSDVMKDSVSGLPWALGLILLAVVYFYSHYFFASATAHVSAMYSAFLAVIVAAGAPGMLAALILAYFSNLFGCITHYGSGPAPVFFGSGYITQGRWWSLGLVMSALHLVIWFGVGGLWWKVLGLW